MDGAGEKFLQNIKYLFKGKNLDRGSFTAPFYEYNLPLYHN